MGECCTRAFAKNQRSYGNSSGFSALIQGIIGSGSHRRVVLPTRTFVDPSQDIQAQFESANVSNSHTLSSSAIVNAASDGMVLVQ